MTAATEAYWQRHPTRQKENALRRNFGISLVHYEKMLANQQGVCAICAQPFADSHARKLCVDHDHQTGKVRGLLCFNCNTVLGKVKDRPEVLRRAAEYLENSH